MQTYWWTCILHHWRLMSATSTVTLWHRTHNKTIIDTQNKWTDLTTLQTVTVLADQLGCGERSLSSSLCTLPFSTALWISPLVIQNHRTDNYTDIGKWLNTRGGNGALTTDCNTRQAQSMKNRKRLDSIHNRRWLIQCKH